MWQGVFESCVCGRRGEFWKGRPDLKCSHGLEWQMWKSVVILSGRLERHRGRNGKADREVKVIAGGWGPLH